MGTGQRLPCFSSEAESWNWVPLCGLVAPESNGTQGGSSVCQVLQPGFELLTSFSEAEMSLLFVAEDRKKDGTTVLSE